MQTILITGGTGSFGQAFVRKILQSPDIGKVIVFSRDEWKQWEMRQIFADPRLRYFLGDVRDRERLTRAFDGVDVVIHAAALKQVPTAEYNPSEYVRTNVLGSMNVIDAAIDCSVKQVVALSTDKAVNPVNLYGATKLCADKLFVAGGAYVGSRGCPKFSVVRYGNVLASRGSVLAQWEALLEGGATSLPITDPEMTRFWITIEEAVDAVFTALKEMQGGEIFVPKAPSKRLIDMARARCPSVDIVGIRPGEKLHEVLISAEETSHIYDCGPYFILSRDARSDLGDPLPAGFTYTSHVIDALV